MIKPPFARRLLLLSVALSFTTASAFAQVSESAGNTLCNTGLTHKDGVTGGCATSSLIYPINPQNGGTITDANWALARPNPSAPATQPAPDPCSLHSAYLGVPVNQPFPAWFNPTDGLSQWIGPVGGGLTPPGWYIYRTQFITPQPTVGDAPYLLHISGQLLVDNVVGAIYLEDRENPSHTCQLVSSSQIGSLSAWTPFDFWAPARPHTPANLYFVVLNQPGTQTGNPTALRVEFFDLTPHP